MTDESLHTTQTIRMMVPPARLRSAAVIAWAWLTRHHVAARALGLVAVGMLTFSGYLFTLREPAEYNRAAVMLVGGSVELAIALLAAHTTGAIPRSKPQDAQIYSQTRTWIRPLPLFMGIGVLALLAEISANRLDPPFLRDVTIHKQVLLLIVGCLLVTLGAAGRTAYQRRLLPRVNVAKLRRALRRSRYEILAVSGVVLLALLVRAWALGGAVHYFVDEIHFVNPVVYIDQVPQLEMLMPFSSVAAFTYLFPYMQWQSVGLFGHTLVGLRAASVLLGTLNVLALYLLARELFGRRTALLAALFLAVFPPHVQFSRLGLNNIADPLLGTLALYCMTRGFNRWRATGRGLRGHFALAGLWLGLTQYFYEGGRLLFPALALAWLIGLAVVAYGGFSLGYVVDWLRRDRTGMDARLWQLANLNYAALSRGTVAMIVVLAMIGLPVYYTLAARGEPLVPRLETAGLREPYIETQFTDAVGVATHFTAGLENTFLFTVSQPETWLYYGGETGLLLRLAVPFFLIGAAYALLRIDQPGALLAVLWVGLTWAGNTLLAENSVSARHVVGFPALALLVGLGLSVCGDMLWPRNRRTRTAVMLSTCALIVVVHVAYFFGPHLTRFNHQLRSTHNVDFDGHDALFRAADLPDGTQVFILSDRAIPERVAREYMLFLNPAVHVTPIGQENLTDAYLTLAVRGNDAAFFIPPEWEPVAVLLRRTFPGLRGPYFSPYHVPEQYQYAMYVWHGPAE